MIEPELELALTTPAEVSEVLVHAYPRAGFVASLMIKFRPYILPFQEIVELLPYEGAVLDVGCGVGLMMVILAYARRARRVIGFDTSRRAIAVANQAELPNGTVREAKVLPVGEPWPTETVDAVTCIDVLHHVPENAQREFVRNLSRLAWTDRLVFKDVAPKPRWMAMMSRLHDLVIARELISIRDEHEVRRWLEEDGLVVEGPKRMHMLWYSHYVLVARRA